VSGESASVGGVVFRPKQARFLTIPQSPLSYWLRERFFDLLAGPTLGDVADVVQGLATANDPRFVRFVWEVPPLEWGREVRARRWAPFEKGGGYGKWFGHHFWAVDWEHSGARIKAFPGSVVRNEQYYFKPGWTYSLIARGAMGARWQGSLGVIGHKGPGIYLSSEAHALAMNSRAFSFSVRSNSPTLAFEIDSVLKGPVPHGFGHEHISRVAVSLKLGYVSRDPTERSFNEAARPDTSLSESCKGNTSQLEAKIAVLHALEGICEKVLLAAYRIEGDNLSDVLSDTGTPAGWHPLIAGYDEIPPLPEDVNIDPKLLAPLKDDPRINPTPDELADLKRRLRALYEAGPGASPDAEEAEAADSDDDESEEAVVSGARIPIPPETFLEELSQKLEIHPISIYWLLRELREKDGVVCLPELRRFVSDHFTVMVLRMLGHRWPRQIEANEPVPDWAEPSGIIPITEGAGADSLLSRVRQRIGVDFGAERVSAIEREFEEIMGVPLGVWLARDFFRNHISQFRKRPIAWQIQSTPETSGASGNGRGKRARRKIRADRTPIFCCLVYYHRLDDQLLGTIRTQYAHPMRLRLETELRELERIDAKTRTVAQEQRRADLIVRIEELKDFEARLERVEQAGFESEALAKIANKEPLDKWTSRDGEREHPRERGAFLAQERRYDPDINDGVRVNIAPLQKAGLLAAEVLAAKDVDKAIADRVVIPDAPLPPGDVFTVGYDADDARYSLFRIQCSVTPGGGRFSMVGAVAKRIRESGRMAYDYLRTTGRKIGIDRDLGEYDINIQLMSHGPSGDAPDLGMALYIALLSAILGRSIGAQLVVLGQMSIHGVLSRVDGLGDKLRVAMDAGARRVLIPTENSRDFASLPPEILDKLRIEFYSEPSQAAFKALAE